MRPTALGYVLLVVPDLGDGKWYVHSFGRSGRWRSASVCDSKADAYRRRRWLVRHHARRAREKAAGAAGRGR